MKKTVYICAPAKNDVVISKYYNFAYSQDCLPTGWYLYKNIIGTAAQKEMNQSVVLRLLRSCSEMWIFGDEITPGMETELHWGETQKKKMRKFSADMIEITEPKTAMRVRGETRLLPKEKKWAQFLREHNIEFYCKVPAYRRYEDKNYIADFYLPELDAYSDVVKRTNGPGLREYYGGLQMSKRTGKDVILAYDDGSFNFIDYKLYEEQCEYFNKFIYTESESYLAKCGSCGKHYFRAKASMCGCKFCGTLPHEVIKYGDQISSTEEIG